MKNFGPTERRAHHDMVRHVCDRFTKMVTDSGSLLYEDKELKCIFILDCLSALQAGAEAAISSLANDNRRDRPEDVRHAAALVMFRYNYLEDTSWGRAFLEADIEHQRLERKPNSILQRAMDALKIPRRHT